MQKVLPPAWRSLLGFQERRRGGLSLSFLVVPSRLSLGKGSGERMAGPCYLLTHEHARNNFNCRGSMHGINNVIHIYIFIYNIGFPAAHYAPNKQHGSDRLYHPINISEGEHRILIFG
jgi:hypothetical protein